MFILFFDFGLDSDKIDYVITPSPSGKASGSDPDIP